MKKAVKPKSKSKSSEHDSEAKADPPSSSKKSDSSTVAKAETTKKHGEFEKPKSTQKPVSKTEIEKPKKPTSKPKVCHYLFRGPVPDPMLSTRRKPLMMEMGVYHLPKCRKVARERLLRKRTRSVKSR